MVLIIGKARPRRVFKDENGKFYMIINGKRKYLKPVIRKGKELTKLHEVQREVRQKIKGRIKLNHQPDKSKIPNRDPRNWKKQNRPKPEKQHRPKDDMRISDVVAAIHRIGRPEDNDPTIFNQYSTPIKYIQEKQPEEKETKRALETKETKTPTIEDKKETIVITTIKGRSPGRPKGSTGKAKLTEIKEEEPIMDETKYETEESEKPIPKKESKSLISSARKAWRDLFKNADEDTDVYEDDQESIDLEPRRRKDDQQESIDLEPRRLHDEMKTPIRNVRDEDADLPSINVDAQPARPYNLRRKDNVPGDLNELIVRERRAEQERRRGKGKILKALWNDQIEEFFEDEPRFTGTYAIDEIKDIPKKIPQGFIINTAKAADKEGLHWQAVYISPDSVEFYDSYGDEPDNLLVKQLKEVIHSWKLPILLKFKVNKVAGQKDTTDTCGFFAMRFLDERFNGVPFEQATRFKRPDNYDVEHEEEQGEKTIKREFSLI